MTLRTLLSLSILILFFSGCSSIKSIFGGDKKQKFQEETVADAAPLPPKEKVPQKPEKEQPARDELHQKEVVVPAPAPVQSTRPKITFGETESANVRIPLRYNDPFSTSGELVLPLDDFKEEFCYPYPGKVISAYGYRGRSMHTGIDIKAIPNDTIRAAWPGVVRMAKPYSGYGNLIVIRHYNGVETVYAHQSRNLVRVNDVVESGDAIGLAGRTGRATTEHLHFEIRIASESVNPTLMVDPDNHCLRDATLYCYNRGGKIRVSTKPSAGYVPEEESVKEKTVASSVPASKTTTSKSSSASSSVYHYVKSGETLSHIAPKYSTTVAKICSLNGIKPTSVLQIKQKLRVK